MGKRIHTQEQIDEMRKRLYARGSAIEKVQRHELTDQKVDVTTEWNQQQKSESESVNHEPPQETPQIPPGGEAMVSVPEDKPKRRRYRSFILVGSLLIFIFVAGISSLFVYFGGNQISNDNIQIAIQGPTVIGGGEVMSLQLGITNQNTVPIESATLILKYPEGTRSVEDSPRNLFEERIPINDIAPGEVLKVPVQLAVFGEENDAKQIDAIVEYRIKGSSGMFYKDANPFAFRISSSPLVLRVESVERVAAGQLVDVKLNVVSNASSPLEDVLITASYPNSFRYENSEPEPVFGENVWRIDELEPEETETIILQGTLSGLTEETFRIKFEAGPANEDNQYLVGATLAEAHADFEIEYPFIDVDVRINGKGDQVVVIPQGEKLNVQVGMINTLDETVYDMVVEVVPGGNALTEDSIESRNGFYDSNTGTVRWEVSNNPDFGKILPGKERNLYFGVTPGPDQSTASFDLEINVYARRVAETSVQETLIGTNLIEVKYSSEIMLGSQVGRNVGRFGDSGPIPPTVGDVTTYTLSVVAEAGRNDVTGATVKTGLPIYVNWLDEYDADGSVIYNPVSKELEWTVGDIPAGEQKEFTFQVSIQPSYSQVDLSPTLLNGQTLRGDDRFTGTLLRDEAPAVTTELSTEMGYEEGNGVIIR